MYYVVVGYGRVGKKVVSLLLDQEAEVTVLDPAMDELDIKHPNLNFLKRDCSKEEHLAEAGFPLGTSEDIANSKDITALILTTGKFSANASVLILADKYFPREGEGCFDYHLIVRARNANDKEIFIRRSKECQKCFIVYSEEAGARAITTAMNVLYRQKKGRKLSELRITSKKESYYLAKLLDIYANQGVQVLDEYFVSKEDKNYYRAVLTKVSKGFKTIVKKMLPADVVLKIVLNENPKYAGGEIWEESELLTGNRRAMNE